MNAAKFLTGFSSTAVVAILVILRHAGLIEAGAMVLELLAFVVLSLTIILFQRVRMEDNW